MEFGIGNDVRPGNYLSGGIDIDLLFEYIPIKGGDMINPDIYHKLLHLLGENAAVLNWILGNVKLDKGMQEYINNQLNEIALFINFMKEERGEE